MDDNERRNEDFTIPEKLVIILFWFDEWKYHFDLKENGYERKFKSRRICIIIGILFYGIIIALATISSKTKQ